MRKNNSLIIAISLVLALVTLTGCAKTEEQANTDANTEEKPNTEVGTEINIDKPSDTGAAEEKQEEKTEPATETTVKEFEMESFTEIIDGEYFPQFNPKELTVKKGDKIRLKINTTSGTHDFKIDELDIYSETPTGEVTVIEFTADKVGEFIYWCTKPRHKELGHWGTLKIVE